MKARSIKAYAAMKAGGPLEPYTFELPEPGAEQLDIRVEYCGICHSDLSMINNEWGISQYPLVPGHEIVGIVETVGSQVKGLKPGDRVGLGWMSESCMHCDQCMNGAHNLCSSVEQTIVSRHGGFADFVRCHWSWATPIPGELDPARVGPLLCGGITVFRPLEMVGVKPTAKVGVIGIGGLGHLALQFLNRWGCDVTAFSSNPGKEPEIRKMGAHRIINSRDSEAMKEIQGPWTSSSIPPMLLWTGLPTLQHWHPEEHFILWAPCSSPFQ